MCVCGGAGLGVKSVHYLNLSSLGLLIFFQPLALHKYVLMYVIRNVFLHFFTLCDQSNTSAVRQLSLSVDWEHGIERGLKTVLFNP